MTLMQKTGYPSSGPSTSQVRSSNHKGVRPSNYQTTGQALYSTLSCPSLEVEPLTLAFSNHWIKWMESSGEAFDSSGARGQTRTQGTSHLTDPQTI